MSNPSQLFLLADHIKLSLLERQRAVSLQLEPNSQDGEISRSLTSLHEGLEEVERDLRSREDNDDPSASELKDQANHLRLQYQDLSTQFYGESSTSNKYNSNESGGSGDAATNSSSGQKRADASPANDDDDTNIPRASNASTTLKHPKPQHPIPKAVRFTDNLVDDADGQDPNRNALLPYRDSPSPSADRHDGLANDEIHAEHTQMLRDQDDQLDRLGESIGRQQQLSIQIGDELEGQIALLDDVDGHVDRHAGRLDGARRNLNNFRRKAASRSGMMTIIGLIIVLVILIVILK